MWLLGLNQQRFLFGCCQQWFLFGCCQNIGYSLKLLPWQLVLLLIDLALAVVKFSAVSTGQQFNFESHRELTCVNTTLRVWCLAAWIAGRLLRLPGHLSRYLIDLKRV